MTITEQGIEFFKEAKRIQELWEPKFGDLALEAQSGDLLVIVGVDQYSLDMVPISWDGWEEGMIHSGLQKHLIFLPRQGQLQEMLREQGYKRISQKMRPDWTKVSIAQGVTYPKKDFAGPTPSMALGRALIEVLGD